MVAQTQPVDITDSRQAVPLQSCPEITQEVLEFLTHYVETVPHLEALLLLWENPQTSWSGAEIAARIYVRPDTAASILPQLARLNLIEKVENKYRYTGEWDENRTMEKVATAYRQNLIPISTFIHSKGPSSVREFAKAFKVRRDE